MKYLKVTRAPAKGHRVNQLDMLHKQPTGKFILSKSVTELLKQLTKVNKGRHPALGIDCTDWQEIRSTSVCQYRTRSNEPLQHQQRHH